MATTSECIMFTILTVMAAATLRKSGLLQNCRRGRSNKTFEEGHVCILRGVTRATLIFLLELDLLKLLRLESK